MRRLSCLLVLCAALVSLLCVMGAMADDKKGKATDEDMKAGPEETLYCFSWQTVRECFGFGPNMKEALCESPFEGPRRAVLFRWQRDHTGSRRHQRRRH